MSNWTVEEDVFLLKSISEGLSGSQIASAMRNIRPNTTRNAVIGRVHRLKLRLPTYRVLRQPWTPSEDAFISSGVLLSYVQKQTGRTIGDIRGRALELGVSLRQPTRLTPVLRTPRLPRISASIDPPPPEGSKRFIEIGHQECRFPYGDPGKDSFRFCGAHAPEGSSYCAAHRAIAYGRAPAPRLYSEWRQHSEWRQRSPFHVEVL